jgi:hypothetical protein
MSPSRQLTNRPTQWKAVVFEKPVFAQLLKKFVEPITSVQFMQGTTLVSVLSQMNPGYAFASYFFEISFNIFPSASCST